MTFEEYYRTHYEFSDDEEFKKALKLAFDAGKESVIQKMIGPMRKPTKCACGDPVYKNYEWCYHCAPFPF